MTFASIGWYRVSAMKLLLQRLDADVEVYAGDRSPDGTVQVADFLDVPYTAVRNRFYRADILVQSLPLRRLLASGVLLADLNPRMPQVWILVMLRRLRGRRTILWGHAWPRSGSQGLRTYLRVLMARLASTVVVYTESQATDLQRRVGRRPAIVAAPNSLYRKCEFAYRSDTSRDIVLSVGRLVPAKKTALLVEAFGLVSPASPLRLVIVGDGGERAALEAQVARLGLGRIVEFLGHVTDTPTLAALYNRAVASVSPGYVGLSIIQSLAYGVPMVVADGEPHAPEIEAAKSGENCVFFRGNDPVALAKTIDAVVADRELWRGRGPQIAADAASRYSVEAMVDGLYGAIEKGNPR